MIIFFFFKQKTAYEMRISDWSSDVCSSDLTLPLWKADNTLANFLAAYERLLPLEKASNLASRDKVAFLAKTGEGVLGKIVNRVKNAALVAITDGSKQITLEHLKQAVTRPVVCGLRPEKEAA